MPPVLPVDTVLPALRDALAARRVAVLQAPPGAGKTTRVPPALLDAPWLRGRILMLEPRRLAARAAAHFMARERGEAMGETVGYRVRRESRVGPRTRIEVVTEGILTRMLQDDPTLDGVGAVLFDEFHERNLQGDVGLALVLHARALVRDDLAVCVMSATLDAAPVARLLGDPAHGGAPVITAEGRTFPVTTTWCPRRPEVPLEGHTALVVRRALAEGDGDVLVFLPGVAELARCAAALEGTLPSGVAVHLLHGALPLAEQDAALAVAPAGGRKVVLATAVAETSLTIEGVRAVVDAGLARVPRFDPRTGMTALATVRVSRASADQRRGRAGRVAPGRCYRLWDEAEEGQLRPQGTPELLEADLAPLALELAIAGIADVDALPWLDRPPAGALAQGRALLRRLGALDHAGHPTPHGHAMARLGTHPRLAHLLRRGADLGLGALACDVAALLEERDLLPRDAQDADLALRVLVLHDPAEARARRADRARVERVRQEARAWRRQLGVADAPPPLDAVGEVAALAYPDRIAQRRPGEAPRFLLANGRGAALAVAQPLGDAPWLVALDVDGDRADVRIHRAASLTRVQLEAAVPEAIEEERVVAWDPETRAVHAVRRRRLGALVLDEGRWPDPDPAAVAAAFAAGVHAAGVGALPWSDAATRLRERLAFAHAQDPDHWPDVSDAALSATLDRWLMPHLEGARRWRDLEALDLGGCLLDLVGWQGRGALERLAPTHVTVPSGSRIPVDYTDPTAPVLAVRLQELFGAASTPAVWDGRVPLLLHLLSPARRPVQVTRDLAGFWRSSYFEVRKDLRGRYPKHHWPDDPLAAPATARAKRKGE